MCGHGDNLSGQANDSFGKARSAVSPPAPRPGPKNFRNDPLARRRRKHGHDCPEISAGSAPARIEVHAIHAIAVMDEIARLPTIRRGVQQLLPHPRHGWMGGDVQMNELPCWCWLKKST